MCPFDYSFIFLSVFFFFVSGFFCGFTVTFSVFVFVHMCKHDEDKEKQGIGGKVDEKKRRDWQIFEREEERSKSIKNIEDKEVLM